MTSVVDTSVKHFTSAMLNAPVLNGVAGSLISLLDACLKDGFDLKTATSLVVADGVATLAYSGTHSATVDCVILVAGSSIADLNGEQRVTEVAAGVVKFATDAADGTATGTITFKIAPAGWTKPFSGTNLAAYQSADPEGTGCYLRVDDTGTTAARVVGYESMSAISTGTGPFPTTAQMNGGGYWTKSVNANANANNWALIADGRFFIIDVLPGTGLSASYLQSITRCFGDAIPLRPAGDAYSCVLSYSSTSSVANQHDGSLGTGTVVQNAMPRSYSGLGSSSLHCSIAYTGNSGSTSGSDSLMGNFPSVIDGGLRLSRKYFATQNSNSPPRADVPGYYWVPQSQVYDTFRWNDRIDGTGPLAGRRLLAVTPAASNIGSSPSTSSNTGIGFVDITGPWR